MIPIVLSPLGSALRAARNADEFAISTSAALMAKMILGASRYLSQTSLILDFKVNG